MAVVQRGAYGLQGYLAVTLLMHENSDFLRLVVNSIRKDLDSNHEVDNCLALHAIANVGGAEMAEALSEDVHRLLISPCVTSFLPLNFVNGELKEDQNFW